MTRLANRHDALERNSALSDQPAATRERHSPAERRPCGLHRPFRARGRTH